MWGGGKLNLISHQVEGFQTAVSRMKNNLPAFNLNLGQRGGEGGRTEANFGPSVEKFQTAVSRRKVRRYMCTLARWHAHAYSCAPRSRIQGRAARILEMQIGTTDR